MDLTALDPSRKDGGSILSQRAPRLAYNISMEKVHMILCFSVTGRYFNLFLEA